MKQQPKRENKQSMTEEQASDLVYQASDLLHKGKKLIEQIDPVMAGELHTYLMNKVVFPLYGHKLVMDPRDYDELQLRKKCIAQLN